MVSRKYFPEFIYIQELNLQAKLGLDAYSDLRAGITPWRGPNLDTDDPRHVPLTVLRNCHSFLTHAACASRMIFSNDRKDNKRKGVSGAEIQRRADQIYYIIGRPDFLCLQDQNVRNMFEHYDEYIDTIIMSRWKKNESSFPPFSQWDLTGGDSGEAFVLRAIDPSNLTVSFLGNAQISLRGVADDLKTIIRGVQKAHIILNEGKLSPLYG